MKIVSGICDTNGEGKNAWTQVLTYPSRHEVARKKKKWFNKAFMPCCYLGCCYLGCCYLLRP